MVCWLNSRNAQFYSMWWAIENIYRVQIELIDQKLWFRRWEFFTRLVSWCVTNIDQVINFSQVCANCPCNEISIRTFRKKKRILFQGRIFSMETLLAFSKDMFAPAKLHNFQTFMKILNSYHFFSQLSIRYYLLSTIVIHRFRVHFCGKNLACWKLVSR